MIGGKVGENLRAEESTGIFFMEQTAAALQEALLAFESVEAGFSPSFIRSQVDRFSTSRFRVQFGSLVEEKVSEFFRGSPGAVAPPRGTEFADSSSWR